MTLEASAPANLKGFGRSAQEQALRNLAEALRALDLAPASDSELLPHPLTIVRAEIENARRYLSGETLSSSRRPAGGGTRSSRPAQAAA